MKIALVAMAMLGLPFTFVRAQAPTSIGGLTFRTAFENSPGLEVRAYYVESIDFFADGTFSARVIMEGATEASYSYATPVTGTYTYTPISGSTATLTANQPVLPTQTSPISLGTTTNLTFVTQSSGGLGGAPGYFNPTFSLTPTYGMASARAVVNMSTLIVAVQGVSTNFGFVIGGTTPFREILVRAVGPSLAQFGVTSFADNPTYSLAPWYPENPGEGNINITNPPPYSNGGYPWSTTPASAAVITAESARVGAFPLRAGSNDKADIYMLPPGAYTITVAPSDPTQAGTELVEIYEVE